MQIQMPEDHTKTSQNTMLPGAAAYSQHNDVSSQVSCSVPSLFGWVLVVGEGGCWLVFGMVLAAGDKASGGACVRSFRKQPPRLNSDLPLAKPEPISALALNELKRGNWFGKRVCFGSSLLF